MLALKEPWGIHAQMQLSIRRQTPEVQRGNAGHVEAVSIEMINKALAMENMYNTDRRRPRET